MLAADVPDGCTAGAHDCAPANHSVDPDLRWHLSVHCYRSSNPSPSRLHPGPGVSISCSASSTLVQVRKIAWLRDSSIPIGDGHSIGLDGIVDLIPWVRRHRRSTCVLLHHLKAAPCGAPQPVLMRMAGNVLINALIGAFRVLGAIADSPFKANIRNVAIFEDFLAHQDRAGIIGIHR